MRTLSDLVFRVRELSGGRSELLTIRRHGRRETVSGSDFVGAVHSLALALEARGLEKGDRVALLAASCPEAHIADLAGQLLGAVTVALSPTLPLERVGYLLKNSGSRWLFYGSPAHPRLLAGILEGVAVPPTLVALDDGDPGRGGLSLTPLLGEGARRRASVPLEHFRGRVAPEDPAALAYLPPEGGEPRTALLRHGDLASSLQAWADLLPLGPEDLALSCLPPSHLSARAADQLFLFCGCPIRYAPCPDLLPAALQEARPTALAASPTLYAFLAREVRERFLARSPTRRRLLAWALGVSQRFEEAREQGLLTPLLTPQRALAELTVHRRLRRAFGGRLRLALSCGGPLDPTVAGFLRGVGLPVDPAYQPPGLPTVVAAQHPGGRRPGSVGRPLSAVEIALGPDGEILCRWREGGQADAPGRPGSGGWLATGDLGAFDSGGFLLVTGRKTTLGGRPPG